MILFYLSINKLKEAAYTSKIAIGSNKEIEILLENIEKEIKIKNKNKKKMPAQISKGRVLSKDRIKSLKTISHCFKNMNKLLEEEEC